MANEELKAKLTADASQMQKALSDVEKTTEKAGQKLQELAKKGKEAGVGVEKGAEQGSRAVQVFQGVMAGIFSVLATLKTVGQELFRQWVDGFDRGIARAKDMVTHLQTMRTLWLEIRNKSTEAVSRLADLASPDISTKERGTALSQQYAELKRRMLQQGREKQWEAIAGATGDDLFDLLGAESKEAHQRAIKDARDAIVAQEAVVRQITEKRDSLLKLLEDPKASIEGMARYPISGTIAYAKAKMSVGDLKNASEELTSAINELNKLRVAAKALEQKEGADNQIELARARYHDKLKEIAEKETEVTSSKAASIEDLEKKLQVELLRLQEDSYHKRLQLVEMELDAKLKAMEAEGYAEEQLLRYREAHMEAFYRKEADRAAQEDRDNLLGARAGILEDLNKIKGEYGFAIGQVKIAGGLLDRWSPDQTSSDRAAIRRADREARKTGRLDERIADKLASGRKLTTREQARADELYKIEKATAMDQPWSTRTVQELLNSLDSIKAQVFVVKGSNK